MAVVLKQWGNAGGWWWGVRKSPVLSHHTAPMCHCHPCVLHIRPAWKWPNSAFILSLLNKKHNSVWNLIERKAFSLSLPARHALSLPTISWVTLKKGWPAGRGRWLCPSTQLLWGPICSTASRPGAPSRERMWSSWRGSRGGPLRWSEGWSTSPMRKGWGNWACLVWRREGSGETSLWPSSTW